MEVMAVNLKTLTLLLLAILALLAPTSDAAQRSRFVTLPATQEQPNFEEIPSKIWHAKKSEEATGGRVLVHERMLMVNTQDYGRYNPSPSLSKPRFKLIPN